MDCLFSRCATLHLTDTGGRSSEFPEEAEPWREVDLTDVEEKMKGLKMEQEADFSEPEQAQLVQPVLAVGSALPSTSSTPSPAADGTLPASGDDGTLPASGDGGALPTSGDGPKHVAEEKKKVIVKAAPSSAQKALAELKPFLRFADGKDSDTEPPKSNAAALPRAPSLNRSRSKSKQERKEKERQSSQKRSKTPRSRSRPVSPCSRDRVIGCVLGQPELAGFTPDVDPVPIYYTSHSPLPTNLNAIPSGSKTFYSGLLTTVACLGKRGNSHG